MDQKKNLGRLFLFPSQFLVLENRKTILSADLRAALVFVELA